MEYAMTANRPAGRPRRPKTFEAGRVCLDDGCTTKLNRYNKREFCYSHAPVKFPRVRGRIEEQ